MRSSLVEHNALAEWMAHNANVAPTATITRDRTRRGSINGPSAPRPPGPIGSLSLLTCTNVTPANAPGHTWITPRVVGSKLSMLPED